MTVLVIALVLAVVPGKALAVPPDVMTIVKQMKEVFEPVRPSTRKVVMTMSAEGEKVQWVAGEARKEFPEGKRMVMVMLEPESVKVMGYLIAEPKNQPSRIWVYLPAIRRVRDLAPVDAYEHFLGADFTY